METITNENENLKFEEKNNFPHKALIILPTKELCMQIYNEFIVFCKYYTSNTIKTKYLTQGMYNSILNDSEAFFNNNDIIVKLIKFEILNIYSYFEFFLI
jgi:superfamily II DNA/RNA helicase